MEFHYKGRSFGAVFGENYFIDFYEFNKTAGYQTYKTKEEFMAQANINGILLKDLWDEVDNAGYMSC